MFIGRRPDGTIYGLWTVRQWVGQEELPDNAPEVVAFLAPRTLVDFADIDNLDKVLKSSVLLNRQYANALKAGTFVVKTFADTRADFMAIYRALP
jgi:hypothetical protein